MKRNQKLMKNLKIRLLSIRARLHVKLNLRLHKTKTILKSNKTAGLTVPGMPVVQIAPLHMILIKLKKIHQAKQKQTQIQTTCNRDKMMKRKLSKMRKRLMQGNLTKMTRMKRERKMEIKQTKTQPML